jgi:RHS repeat-associated protein
VAPCRSITLRSKRTARAHVWGKQAERSEAVGGIPALGTPETLTDASGAVTHQAFDPFGTRRDGPGLATRIGYTGQHQDDDLGLIDMGGRVYDPLAGRFTTADPIMQAPYWSQGQNRYAYVFNDPINLTDPSGFMSSSETSGGLSPAIIGGGITGGAFLATQTASLSGWSLGFGGGAAVGNVAMTLTGSPFGGSSGGSYGVAAPSGTPNANPVKPGGTNAVGQGSPPGPVQERAPIPSLEGLSLCDFYVCLAEHHYSGGAGASGGWDPPEPRPTQTDQIASDAGRTLTLLLQMARAKARAGGLTPGRLRNYLADVGARSRTELVSDLQSMGLKVKGSSPDGRFMEFIDDAGRVRAKIHPPDQVTPTNHLHIYDKAGRSLDVNLRPVSPRASGAHIPIQ